MKIAEVSERCGLSPDTLRYYERIGLIPAVNRDSRGIRDYTEEDCRWIEFIKCMRNAGLPIEVLIEYVDLFQQGDETAEARKNLLIKERDKLAKKINEMEQTLALLNYKIERYEQKMVPIENELKKALPSAYISEVDGS
ncbi:MerR family transcriptional regulator [Mahella australiensis]|uniref:Transcriptional regulator, MerR family n=1 Tax=Mahella australiensis (strain DSM 15567 / CIP 107919 / 50-1 BON) TaxID=697281 RepID=F3ZZR4_MAHA5|nr:MerR family transcriptional regulator [Mahella australiensis]AEE97911.1 transcriptional regulator, MerR family [Mahella australiensis 50-1 BON]